MTYKFEVPGTIVGKERPRVNTYTLTVYTPNKTKDYENLIIQYFYINHPGAIAFEGRVKISVIAYFKIPKSTSKKYREKMIANEISPTKKPDADNIGKVVLDALNKVAFKDDNQVSSLFIEKRYSEDEEKIEIEVDEY